MRNTSEQIGMEKYIHHDTDSKLDRWNFSLLTVQTTMLLGDTVGLGGFIQDSASIHAATVHPAHSQFLRRSYHIIREQLIADTAFSIGYGISVGYVANRRGQAQ